MDTVKEPGDKPINWRWPNFTVNQYDAMLKRQGGGCAICHAKPKTRRLNIDHDHKTGRIRGLLCHRCNRFLPTFAGATWLRRAADYLDGKVDVLAAVREVTPTVDEMTAEAAKVTPRRGDMAW